VLSGAPENALAESESTLQSSRGAWEYLEALVRATGESVRFPCGFQTDLHFTDENLGLL